ncbi:Afadin and alpha-actinin-binding-domain-containing protein [Hypoxylon trugodes]|uniref:Afadin and alpha-actinin-binding-domain-containing protein n=1 Tax=Hypoxylon trugodes TaxID=326681 RepID=UPI0021994DEA|nr:Afadin and alpha-actinin-binding-domain-containing protein [Hypoxylon trugodes]KAI1389399.1 Afadin and alpha-actinin-binding-domain-containing protein [Hypoxylon trugodes]
MVDPDNLRTASLYINNQLMSRGLLRDGHNIDFASPEAGDGGLQATMGKVMSVINDLILRRDRDAENRESLSTTLRTLRADSQRQTTELARQSDKLSETQRKLDSADANERALRAQLKTAEQNAHRLKEDAVKSKTLLAQARAACANEVRKRDRQIDGLKKAVADASRIRGGNRNRDVLCISVTGEVGADERELPVGATQAEGYSLRLETNQFLTELARGLSEENEGLLALVKRTVEGLRDMSGLERGSAHASVAGADRHSDNGCAEVVVLGSQKSADELAAELEGIMEHLRTILTNPSFVPIEEVEVREEAINRLRAALETMESRWKEAVHMIDGWRKRMTSSGRSVDIEDLRMGLRLSPVRVRDVEETDNVVPMRLSGIQEEEEYEETEEFEQNGAGIYEYEQEPQRLRSPSPVESLHLVPAPGYEAENESDSDSSSIFQDEDIDIEDLDAEEPNVQVLQESVYEASMDSPPLPIPPQLSPLKDSYSSGNRGVTGREHGHRKRPGDFTTIIEENTWDLAVEEEQAPAPPPHLIKPQSPQQQKKTATGKASPPWQDLTRPSSTASYDSPLFGKSGERPSQSDPSRKLFSKPTSSPSQPTQTKSQPEPGSANTQASSKPSRRPASSRESPGPLTAEIKRTTSDPTDPRPLQKAASILSKQTTPATQSRPNSSSSTKATITVVSENKQSPQQPSIPRPRSPLRNNQTASSRLPRPNSGGNPPPQSPLTMNTIAAKLAAAERDADAARVKAKLRAIRGGRKRDTALNLAPASSGSAGEQVEEAKTTPTKVKKENNGDSESMDPVKRDPAPTSSSRSARRENLRPAPAATGQNDAETDDLAGSFNGNGVSDNVKVTKRRRDRGERRTSKVASRRRSTLSPWEMQTLIQGQAAGPGTPVNCS